MQTLDEQLGPILASKPEALGNRFPVLNEIRRRTNARMISMFTCAARGLRRTLESIATPCSVNARGGFRVPPQLDVPDWNIKLLRSPALS